MTTPTPWRIGASGAPEYLCCGEWRRWGAAWAHLRACHPRQTPAPTVATEREPRRRVTHCPQGHEYTAENTYLTRDRNNRVCRTCRREGRRRPAPTITNEETEQWTPSTSA